MARIGSFQRRPTAGGSLIGARLICYTLELKGEDINFREFPGTITKQCPDGQYYGIFGDDDELDRYFKAEEIGQFTAYLPTEEDDDNESGASVMLKTDHQYTDEEIVGALKAALTGAWHARKKKAEEEANDAILAIDQFSPS